MARSSDQEFFEALCNLGVSRKRADRLVEHAPPGAYDLVKADPYYVFTLAPDLNFARLDRKIMQGGNVDPNNSERVGLAAEYILTQDANRDGNTWLSLSKLHQGVRSYSREYPITVSAEQLLEVLPQTVMHLVGERMALRSIYECEEHIAETLGNMVAKPRRFEPTKKPSLPLTATQAEGVQRILQSSVSLMTGGPGCGKTFTIRGVIEAAGNGRGEGICLCAPTGKAAKRMTEATGLHASTIHSLIHSLEEERRTFHTLIVDECSMVPVELMSELLTAVTPESKPPLRLLLVGDNDQLPSIGAGRLFGDLLESGRFETVHLTQIMRQAAGSSIIRNAANIRIGAPMQRAFEDAQRDCFMTLDLKVDEQCSMLLRGISAGMPKLAEQLGRPIDPMRDLLVLVPQYKGTMGCQNLNLVLQAALNPPAPNKQEMEVKYGGPDSFTFRQGDRVIVTKNMKQLEVVNGEMGFIKSCGNGSMSVFFEDDGKTVIFDKDATQNVRPGYAITVHKSQGSESPVVVAVFNRETPSVMRNRNLLYTAVTRAKHGLWVIGDSQTISDCINNDRPSNRKTMLTGMVEQVAPPKPTLLPQPPLPVPGRGQDAHSFVR